jgi:ubiquinol-cytochrome c reductase cytochrome b subunit
MLLKSNPYLSIINSYVIDSPSPINLSYIWNYGSLLGLCLIIQIISGVTLAMHYTPEINLAFISVEHIMRDVSNGWIIRYIHANAASLFFACVYIHIGKAIYYGSYKRPREILWNIGVIIFLLMMATAFLGYVLPWGSMSYWGATVITNFFSALGPLGPDLVKLIWGGFSVDNATLNRFFSLHYLLPFILAALAVLHLIALHQHGSNNPLGISSNSDKISFHPYYIFKDLVGFNWFFIILIILIFYYPNALGHPDNYIPANPLVTPTHIQPEWYFLAFYAILRSIPNKLGGVIAMFLSIVILFSLPITDFSYTRSSSFRPFNKILFWFFVFNFFLLIWIGAKPVAEPFLTIGFYSTCFYFLFFIFSPILSLIENSIADFKSLPNYLNVSYS